MKATFVPAQIVVADAATEIVGAVVGLIVTVMPVEVPLVGVAQPKFEVITQVTASLFAKAALVKTALFEPAFTPFTRH